MALGIYFSPKTPMSARLYNECIKRLQKAGAGHPPGRIYHTSFGSPDNLAVFDVWTSQAAFDAFGETLMPILAQIGLDPGPPAVMPIHNVIVPPAPKAAAKKTAAKKSAPKKRSAAPKSKPKRAARKR
jgi:hypothetical protein